MLLSDLLPAEQLLPHIAVHSREDLLTAMSDAIRQSSAGACQTPAVRDAIPAAVASSDAIGSTAVEFGIALPHCRIANFDGIGICIATLAHALPWPENAPTPVRLAALLISPANNPTLHLRVQSQLLRALCQPAIRDQIQAATSAEAMLAVFQKLKLTIDNPLRACDIMRAIRLNVYTHTPLSEVTHLMSEHKVEAVAVLDEEERVLGEITCDALFQRGVPDFFTQLPSVAFMRKYDPFERYFEEEHHATADTIMSSEFASCGPDATLMEVVHLLSVHKNPKVYVLDENRRRLGIIDRLKVIDRIFTL